MKIMQLEDAPLVRGLEHRGGTFHSRTMAEGTPGTPGNFKFSLSWLGTDYSGPRTGNNSDKYGSWTEAKPDTGKNVPPRPGILGSNPEAVPTEQQLNRTEISGPVLKFGGAGGPATCFPVKSRPGWRSS